MSSARHVPMPRLLMSLAGGLVRRALLLVLAPMGSATIHDADMLYCATPPAGRVDPVMLVLPHLPFQAVYTRVAGVVSQSAADHADNGQSRKAEPELIHIELLMMRRLELLMVRRRAGSRAIALNRLHTLPAMSSAVFRERTQLSKAHGRSMRGPAARQNAFDSLSPNPTSRPRHIYQLPSRRAESVRR
jgi:hypothetical protein